MNDKSDRQKRLIVILFVLKIKYRSSFTNVDDNVSNYVENFEPKDFENIVSNLTLNSKTKEMWNLYEKTNSG